LLLLIFHEERKEFECADNLHNAKKKIPHALEKLEDFIFFANNKTKDISSSTSILFIIK